MLNGNALVLLVDISGSINRHIQAKLIAHINQLLENLKNNQPDTKVALITFDSQGHYYGDGKQKKKTIKLDDFLNNNKAEFNQIKSDAEKLESINKSFANLVNKIHTLIFGGGSSIFSALAHSVVLASAFKKCEIIIFTDGVVETPENVYVDLIKNYFNENAT